MKPISFNVRGPYGRTVELPELEIPIYRLPPKGPDAKKTNPERKT